MSIYNQTNDVRLEKYLRRKANEDRKLSDKERMAYLDMKGRIDDGYRLSRTIGCYILLARELEDVPYQVTANLMRIKDSMERHAGKAVAVKRKYQQIKPDREDADAINYFFKKFERRKKYIRDTVIPSAIDLMPVKEYIDLFGEDVFEEELRAVARNHESASREAFAKEIVRATRENGVGDIYKERLAVYLRRDAEIKEIAKRDAEEKKRTDIARKHEDNEEMLWLTGARLVDAWEQGKEIPELGWNVKSLHRTQAKATSPAYVVIVGYQYRNQFNLRYLKNGYELGTTIGTATPYTQEDAEQAAQMYVRRRPERSTMTVRIL